MTENLHEPRSPVASHTLREATLRTLFNLLNFDFRRLGSGHVGGQVLVFARFFSEQKGAAKRAQSFRNHVAAANFGNSRCFSSRFLQNLVSIV